MTTITVTDHRVQSVSVVTKGTQGIQGATGAAGATGSPGADGADGADGQGVPVGGTARQRLNKIDGTDYNTAWENDNIENIYTMTNALIDGANGGWQKRTLAGNETLTFDLDAGESVFVSIVIGANTLTLTNVDEWVGGSAPATIEAEHLFLFWSDDGVTISGNSIGGIA